MDRSKIQSAWGRIGGYSRAARNDSRILARSGQNGLLRRFEHEVDPDGTLDTAQRAKRVRYAQKAHMLRLNLVRTQQRAAAETRVAPRTSQADQ